MSRGVSDPALWLVGGDTAMTGLSEPNLLPDMPEGPDHREPLHTLSKCFPVLMSGVLAPEMNVVALVQQYHLPHPPASAPSRINRNLELASCHFIHRAAGSIVTTQRSPINHSVFWEFTVEEATVEPEIAPLKLAITVHASSSRLELC